MCVVGGKAVRALLHTCSKPGLSTDLPQEQMLTFKGATCVFASFPQELTLVITTNYI